MLHHNLNCHHHQVISKKNICDNHDTYVNSNGEYNVNLHEATEELEGHVETKTNNLNYTSEGTITSGNKMMSSKVKKVGKGKKNCSSNTSRKIQRNKDMCAHCHCAIPQTYTRQVIDVDGGSVENKNATHAFDHIVDEDNYRGKISYVHLYT